MKTGKLTEKEFQRQVIQLAKLCGWRVAHFRPAMVRSGDGNVKYVTPVEADGKGFPDLVMVNMNRGKTIFVELKADKGRLTGDQAEWLVWLQNGGQETHVWRPADWDEIEEILGVR